MKNEIERMEKIVSQYPKKTIHRLDLMAILYLNITDAKYCYQCIQMLEEKGYLKPIINSGTNGNNQYPLYNRYRIIQKEKDFKEDKKNIERLHPLLLKDGYLLKHIDEYRKYEKEWKQLSDYLFSNTDKKEISRKERSYMIFGKEKVLDDKRFKGLLKRLRISKHTLHFYDTPEYCFHDFIMNHKNNMKLLICENKDIWFDIRRIMFEKHTGIIFNTAFDGVIYGNGNKASAKNALTEYAKFLQVDTIQFYYWGDIDRAGLDIYLRAKAYNPNLDISLFIPGYYHMLHAVTIDQWELSKDFRRHNFQAYEEIYSLFDSKDAQTMRQIIDGNYLLPQEIINYNILMEKNYA